MSVMMATAEQDRADDIHDESQHRHDRGLVERDRARVQQPLDRFKGYPDRDDAKDQRRGEAGEIADLARPEAVAPVARMAPGKGVGRRRHGQRSGMGRHVETVREQRHRVVDRTGDDLADHHDGRQRDDPQGPPRIGIVAVAEKDMVVAQRCDVVLGRHLVLRLTWHSGG